MTIVNLKEAKNILKSLTQLVSNFTYTLPITSEPPTSPTHKD